MVIQHDLLEDAATCVVARLVPASWTASPLRGLMPVMTLGDVVLRLNPLQLTTLRRSDLGKRIGTAAHHRDEITRALDLLLTGI